jgi:hypothetical protein
MENAASLESVNVEVPSETDKLKTEVKSEVMDREKEEVPKAQAKCCHSLKKDSGKCAMCIIKTWSLCLNFCECICEGCSNACLFCSAVCLGCNKCLEQVDCDGN